MNSKRPRTLEDDHQILPNSNHNQAQFLRNNQILQSNKKHQPNALPKMTKDEEIREISDGLYGLYYEQDPYYVREVVNSELRRLGLIP